MVFLTNPHGENTDVATTAQIDRLWKSGDEYTVSIIIESGASQDFSIDVRTYESDPRLAIDLARQAIVKIGQDIVAAYSDPDTLK